MNRIRGGGGRGIPWYYHQEKKKKKKLHCPSIIHSLNQTINQSISQSARANKKGINPSVLVMKTTIQVS